MYKVAADKFVVIENDIFEISNGTLKHDNVFKSTLSIDVDIEESVNSKRDGTKSRFFKLM